LFQLAVFIVRVWRDPSREARTAAIGFGVLTALTSVAPQSHELRYYFVWIIVLVATNLWLACRRGATQPSPRVLGTVSLVVLAFVIAVTHGVYAYPSGSTFAELVRERVDERSLGDLKPGARVCVMREPYNLLWAAPFHATQPYVVKEAEDASDCEGWPTLP
jgi:hypothetical protein